jgi:hypothetical protein
MTKELFRKAFEAGEDRGRFVMKEGDSNAFHSDYPDFETWYEQNYCNTVLCGEGINVASTVSIPYDYNNTVTVAKPPSTPTAPLLREWE